MHGCACRRSAAGGCVFQRCAPRIVLKCDHSSEAARPAQRFDCETPSCAVCDPSGLVSNKLSCLSVLCLSICGPTSTSGVSMTVPSGSAAVLSSIRRWGGKLKCGIIFRATV